MLGSATHEAEQSPCETDEGYRRSFDQGTPESGGLCAGGRSRRPGSHSPTTRIFHQDDCCDTHDPGSSQDEETRPPAQPGPDPAREQETESEPEGNSRVEDGAGQPPPVGGEAVAQHGEAGW